MTEKKRILFICKENSCRSQMAEGFARFLGEDKVEAYSAGSNPASEVNPKAIEVMGELGIDISKNKPKGFLELPQKNFDYVISMGCQDLCPFYPAERQIHWDIADPQGKDIDYFRKVRDKIKMKVEELVRKI